MAKPPCFYSDAGEGNRTARLLEPFSLGLLSVSLRYRTALSSSSHMLGSIAFHICRPLESHKTCAWTRRDKALRSTSCAESRKLATADYEPCCWLANSRRRALDRSSFSATTTIRLPSSSGSARSFLLGRRIKIRRSSEASAFSCFFHPLSAQQQKSEAYRTKAKPTGSIAPPSASLLFY